MERRGLLSRLSASTVDEARSVDPLTSVLANLRVLLNARSEMAASCAKYGVRAVSASGVASPLVVSGLTRDC